MLGHTVGLRHTHADRRFFVFEAPAHEGTGPATLLQTSETVHRRRGKCEQPLGIQRIQDAGEEMLGGFEYWNVRDNVKSPCCPYIVNMRLMFRSVVHTS